MNLASRIKSLGFVGGLSLFWILNSLFLILPAPAHAGGASFYASPGGGSYNQGGVIQVAIYLNSGGQGINAVEGSVTWSGMQYSYVSTSGSIITNWASGGGSGPVGSGTSVYFSGGMPGGGYNGGAGRILTIVFNANAAGTATINVNGTQALVGDGTGSNAYCCSNGASYTINKQKPPTPLLTVKSSTHPNEGQWYNNHQVNLNWFATTGNNGYTWGFDHNARTEPGGSPTGTISASYNDVADGIWYFHLHSANETGGSTVHFQVNIDSVPPDDFKVTTDNEGNASNPTPRVNFDAHDAVSGIDHYDVSIDGAAPFRLNSGDHLPKTRPGDHSIVVRAYDKAGNVRESKATFNIVGIVAPKILKSSKEVVILKVIPFTGQSDPDDTIIVYLNDKEVDRFVAKDKQVPKERTEPQDKDFKDGITWEYEYKTPLFPAEYGFRFGRINRAGAESALTPIYKVKVLATAAVKNIASTSDKSLVRLLLGIIFFLLLAVAYLMGRLHNHGVPWLKGGHATGPSIFQNLGSWLVGLGERLRNPRTQVKKPIIATTKENSLSAESSRP